MQLTLTAHALHYYDSECVCPAQPSRVIVFNINTTTSKFKSGHQHHRRSFRTPYSWMIEIHYNYKAVGQSTSQLYDQKNY
jgi:hypothetical protein